MRDFVQDSMALEAEDQEGRTPLLWAVDRGQAETVKYLLQLGAALDHQDVDGDTAIHMAVLCEHEDIVQMLLEAGVDTRIQVRCHLLALPW
eukprot:SAG31_NODE_3469_length_4238_cov_2.647741_3_plen_91_part_00